MLNLNVNISKKGKGYEAVFVVDENGKEVHSEDWGTVISAKTKVARRLKAFQLDGKALTISLNITDSTKDKTPTVAKKRSVRK